MSRDTILLFFAVLIAVAPFAGIPFAWFAWIFPIVGFATLIIGISLRRDRKARSAAPQAS
jgi:Na+/H+ antiporter NhaC